jgi:hypothetical protein
MVRWIVPLVTGALLVSVLAQEDLDEVIKLIPEEYKEGVKKALKRSGKNVEELIGAIRELGQKYSEGIAFLLANMPRKDLKRLTKGFLVENVKYAYLAKEEFPWGRELPKEIFLNYVLPYANIHEKRDRWRKDFYERFKEIAQGCKDPAEVVYKLNKWVKRKVKYDRAKTKYPHQSPYESLKSGFATCTGLSILLTDACRAVGIPARLAGTPFWRTRSGGAGNHVWVEVWIGEWFYTGGGEPRDKLNKTWFDREARGAKKIFAVSFERRKKRVNMTVANPYGDNVTRFYRYRRKVRLKVEDKEGCPGQATVEIRFKGRLIVKKRTKDGIIECDLAGKTKYRFTAYNEDGVIIETAIRVPRGKGVFELTLRPKDSRE